jgi:hypothetical protein
MITRKGSLLTPRAARAIGERCQGLICALLVITGIR